MLELLRFDAGFLLLILLTVMVGLLWSFLEALGALSLSSVLFPVIVRLVEPVLEELEFCARMISILRFLSYDAMVWRAR